MTDQKEKDFVALIEDPYGLSTLEVSEAQRESDALELDEEETDAIDIGALARRMAEESAEEDSASAPSEEIAQELSLDPESPIEPLDEAQLSRINEAMDEARAEVTARVQELSEEHTQDAAEELAAQIAEDQAVAEALAKEAEEFEEGDAELQAALPKAPETLENGELDLQEMESCIEALLFMSDKPMSTEKLRDLLGPDLPLSIFQEAITSLRDRYKANHHGFELVEVANSLQFRTKPGRAALARKLAKIQTQRLSSGGMETLAIIAYKQPAMKEDIDKIRGVDTSYFIRGLLDKKLIQISGRSDLPGRPMLYCTTPEFLEVFGLKDLSDMPPLHEVEKMIPASQSGNPDEEDPRVKEMRRLVSQMKSDNSTNLIYNPREDEKILKEIKDHVNAIPTSTPYLEMQKELERQAALAAQQAEQMVGDSGIPADLPPPPPGGEQPSLPMNS